MNYSFSRKSSGGSFDESLVNAVWQKGKIVVGYDPNKFRKDWVGFVAYWTNPTIAILIAAMCRC